MLCLKGFMVIAGICGRLYHIQQSCSRHRQQAKLSWLMITVKLTFGYVIIRPTMPVSWDGGIMDFSQLEDFNKKVKGEEDEKSLKERGIEASAASYLDRNSKEIKPRGNCRNLQYLR